MIIEEKYMRRALQLASHGLPHAFPNPMVGAVIVDNHGHIIGEGYHRMYGEAHAEVNAVNSVADKSLLNDSTIYVTLEPCAHYGHTPPCSKLIIDSGIPNVVVGSLDPFDKVNGKGIEMMRAAGINVHIGCLQDECRSLNAVFFTAHLRRKPFVMLKWARSADGYTDIKRSATHPSAKLSTPATMCLVHRLRACFDAIMAGSGTVMADNPTLSTRLWPGKSPIPIILDRRNRITADAAVFDRNPIVINEYTSLDTLLNRLYEQKITSLLVEGGPTLLQSFIDAGLWDIAREEIAPADFGDNGASYAPSVQSAYLKKTKKIDGNQVNYYVNNPLIDVKNL